METKLLATDGKFFKLQKLNGIRFNSNVIQKSENGQPFSAHEAIENGRFVFLYGDGGMGKSTALFDYMQKPDTIAFYLELSHFNHNETNQYIFDTILKDICKDFNDTSFLNDYKDVDNRQTPAKILEGQLTLETEYPEFILFLDGYNEIKKDLSRIFDSEVKTIKEKWNNVRIVITGRTIPKDYDGHEVPIYNNFNHFEYIGLAEEERQTVVFKSYPETADRIKKDSRLWSILRIPMFMGMFLNLNVDTTSIVHTRGEILDQFINQTEVITTKQIAFGQSEEDNNAAFRQFIVEYALPFIANKMDEEKKLYISYFQAFQLIDYALDLYYKNKALRRLLQIHIPKLPKEDEIDDIIEHIIINETGYCYGVNDSDVAFSHQYFQDYFAAKHIQNILKAAQALGNIGLSKDEQLQFTRDNGLDYTWSDDVCILLGEIIGDYKNEPGYSEE